MRDGLGVVQAITSPGLLPLVGAISGCTVPTLGLELTLL